MDFRALLITGKHYSAFHKWILWPSYLLQDGVFDVLKENWPLFLSSRLVSLFDWNKYRRWSYVYCILNISQIYFRYNDVRIVILHGDLRVRFKYKKCIGMYIRAIIKNTLLILHKRFPYNALFCLEDNFQKFWTQNINTRFV